MTKNHKEKEEVDEEEEEGCKDKNGNTIIINSRHTSKILAACLLCRAKYTYSFRINSHGSTAASSAAAEMMDRDRVLKQAWELCMNLKQQRYLGDDFEYAPHEWIVFEEQWRSIEVDEMR